MIKKFSTLLATAVFLLVSCGQSETALKPDETSITPAEAAETDDILSVEHEPDTGDFFQSAKIEFPAPDPVFGMIGSRNATSLNGQWNVIVDPMGVGNPGLLQAGYFLDAKNVSGMELIEYDFDAANSLRVPGDWNSQSERLFFYQGQVWYRRLFDHEPVEGKRYHLHFGAVNFHAQVFLNGQPAVEHIGGYVPFSLDVTELLNTGHNSLVVRVDNSLNDNTVPTGQTDWWPYGGIVRDVSIVETPATFIRNAKIQLHDGSRNKIAVTIIAEGSEPGTEATVEINDLEISETVRLDNSGIGQVVIDAQPQLWSPDNPELYNIRLSVGQDTVTDRVGFRTIETRGTQLILNGEPIKFRGISTHEEPIGEPGVAYSREHVTELLQEAKELNANFVRAAHYPYSRHMAEIADEVGLLLWEEIPVYWAIDWKNPDTFAIAENQMTRLISRDWNRASVVIWSVANETPASESRIEFLRKLIDMTREMDDTRLVSAALLGGSRETFERLVTHLAIRALETEDLSLKDRIILQAIRARAGQNAPAPSDNFLVDIDDPLAEYVDIISYNEYFGWYYSKLFAQQTGVSEGVFRKAMLEMMPDMRIQSAHIKPIHISEFGAGAKAGFVGGEALIWTEEYQAAVYEAQIQMLRNSPQVQGMTPWILKDFRAMLRTRAEIQDFYNRKGLIDEKGNRKLAFSVLSEFYQSDW